jgi:hypothetical protein
MTAIARENVMTIQEQNSLLTNAMSVVASGANVSLDETAGLQNATATSTPAGDADDNDILVASLPSTFSARLTALGAGTATGAALSGYTGAVGNTGSNAFTVTADPGASITNISFVDSTGAPLNGLDSGLDTLNGTSIFLYTDANNDNIVLGRAGGATGAIVFAAYIEETGSPVSGGKIWTVEYQPLKHPGMTNPDDSLNLLDKVFVGASQDLEFSLANAPSGQNLFLMFTKLNPATETVGGVVRITDPVIIATGKNPADQSSGVNITTGDTINTSQAGGPTTFGTNNQMITEQEGIRYSFVTGARQDMTIPNLDQNEADVESNIDFTGVFNARMANFDVVQLQSGKSAVVKISAFTTAAEPGVNFINGYAGDASVAITNVRVFNISTGQVIENSNGTVNDPAITITLTGGVATLTGIKAGYQIEYTTTSDHNRVLIENGAALDAKGTAHADFDIGGFTLVQASISKTEIGSKMIFEDDGPSISTTGTEPTLTVDETTLATNATQSFAANFSSAFGADGAGTLTYALGVVAGGSGLTDTATGEAVNLSLNGTVVEGRTATTNLLVFTVSVAANGDVTLDQIRAVVHPVTTNPDDSKSLTADNLVTLTATKTDGDGDSAQATLNIGQNLVFKDDGPSINTTGTEPALTVDETLLGTDATQSFAANFSSAFGADGAGTLTYALGVVAGASGLTDTASGEAVNLSLNAGVVEGRTATTNLLVFTVSVAANGSVTLDQIRAVVHPVTTDPDDAKSLSADNLVTLIATKTDKDGDSAQATLNIGQNLVFKDDGASVNTTGTEPTLTVDETTLATNATQSFAANFSSAFGADGAGTLTYALGVVAGGSGLTDTATGEAVNLSLNGTVVEGRTATTNLLVFTVSVAANGDVTLDQIRAVVHPVTTNPDDTKTLSADNLVTLTATKTDGDGDSAQALLNIGQNLVFKDDGPSINTTGTEPTLTVDETTLATDATQNFAANFSSAFGADGAGTLTYALGVVAGASGLTDTATNEAVNLSLNAGVVEGRTATTNQLVFTVSVAANGSVTLDQIRAVVHPVTTNPDDSKTLTADNLVTLIATKTDGDGDSTQATLNIGQNLVFKDDGPSISTTGTEPTLTVDETTLATNATQSFAANFSSAFGADGAGTLTYALGVIAGASGLVDTASGQAVNLSLNAGVVEGRTATSNLLVFTVSVAANGDVTLDQIRAVVHPDATNPDDAKSLSADNLVTLIGTKTDKDGDSAQATLNIGQNLSFEDDGPSLAFSNLIGTGSVLPQTGFWNKSAGADGLGATGLDISVNSQFTLVRPDNSTTTGTATLTEQSPSPDGNGAYHFAGTLTGDFDNNAATANTSVDYTLTAFDNGSYTLDLVQGFSSTIVRSSADGSLAAGGPDAVRTLLIPEQNPPIIPSSSEEIVFFGVNATTTSSSIFSAIGVGAPDLTEAQIEASGFAFIGTANMNVSTSGIGIGNNNLDGNTTPGINAGDESFVINPETLLTGMKVFIDNSVGGYSPATEALYYTIFYQDGTTSGSATKVLAADLTPETGGQTSFVIEREGSKLIDAVQLTMGLGVVKIPVIQFIQETENLASDVKLTFNATLTDKDGDSASSTFDANLFANDLGGTFDFTLVGTGGERDAFNVDLSFGEDQYQVTGFDAGANLRDTLVLNGDQNAVVQIDNNGANSIVTVTETGGAITTITLVGVDLLSSDIVLGSV